MRLGRTGLGREVVRLEKSHTCADCGSLNQAKANQAAFLFCCALTLAQRAFCAAAILRRAAADTTRGRDLLGDVCALAALTLAHRARCAAAIRRRAAGDNLLVAPAVPRE